MFGLASLVYPPLKVIIGSVTTSAALMLGGVALMVLPSLVVGNELLILGVVGWRSAAGSWPIGMGSCAGWLPRARQLRSARVSNQSSVASDQ